MKTNVNVFGARLKECLDEKKMKSIDLSEATGISQSLISRYLSNAIKPANENLFIIAKALDVSPEWLIGLDKGISPSLDNTEQSIAPYLYIPLYKNIDCNGKNMFDDENVMDYIVVATRLLIPHNELFAEIAYDDSMQDLGISSGDILIFEKHGAPYHGMVGCYCYNGNNMCRKVLIQGGMMMLQSMNTSFDTIAVDPVNDSFAVVGRLRRIIKNFK